MTIKPLKLGFIGGALDSAVGATHKIASQMDERWQLSCGCFSTESSMNKKTGSSWGVEQSRIYNTWEELLLAEKDKIDAISILTPTPSHKEIVGKFLEHGYAVISEKALTASTAEALEIKNLVKNNNSYLAVTYNYTAYPMVRELKKIIEKSRLGKLNQIHIEMPQEGFARLGKDKSRPTPQNWRLEDGSVPTLHLDLAVHVHQIIEFITNEKPIELVAANNNFGFFDDIVDNTLCIARYTGNVDCNIWFGKTALGHSNGLRLRVYGTEGSAEWYQMEPEVVEMSNNLGQTYKIDRSAVEIELANEARYNRFKAGHPAGFIEAFANYYYDLADSLIEYRRSGRHTSPWIFGADTAFEGLVMLEAMQKSVNNKSWIKIENN